MSSFRFARSLLVATVALGVAGCERAPGAGADLVLVTIDTLRHDHLGCTGHPDIATPTIDSLAARGFLFENAVCQVPLTLPSHCSMMTALQPDRHGVRTNEHFLTDSAGAAPPTLAEVLGAAGYATAAFVSGFPLEASFGLARGFDHYDDELTTPEERALPSEHRLRAERRAGETIDAALAWLAARAADGERSRPVFLWVHLYDPHDPYEPPAGFRQGYAGEIEYTDRELGRLLSAFAPAARGEGRVEPLVVVVADHGEGLGEHGEPTHGLFIYDSTMRVPLVVAGPGVARGARTHEQVETVDLLPTLCAWLGVESPGDIDGRSVAASLRGDAPGTESGGSDAHVTGFAGRAAYLESQYAAGLGWAPLRAVRAGGWKYVDAPRPELYDLTEDPNELENLFDAEPGRAEPLARWLEGRAAAGDADPTAIADERQLARLRSLGYLSGGSGVRTESSAVDPKDRAEVAARLSRAESHLLARETDAAIRILEEVFAEDARNPYVANRLGNAHKLAGRLGAAASWYRRAVAIAPRSPEASYQLADTYHRMGEPDSAIAYFRRTVALQPRRVMAQANLGVSLMQLGRVEEARDALARAEALDPDDGRVLANLGAVTMSLGDAERAFALLSRAAEIQGEAFPYRFELGALHLRRGELDAARQLLERVQGPKAPHAELTLAAIAAQEGRLADGLTRLASAVRLGGDEIRRLAGRDPRLAPLRATPEGAALLGDR